MKPYDVLCPLHKERTPSCRVWPTGWFYCHGCQSRGHVQDFPELLSQFQEKSPPVSPESTRQLRLPGL